MNRLVFKSSVGELRGLLLDNTLKKNMTQVEKRARDLRTSLFDLVMGTQGSSEHIRNSVGLIFNEIAANGLEGDAALVADSIKAWGVAYCGVESIILDAIFTEANCYLDDAGEGVVIGLLELFSEVRDDEELFAALYEGQLVSIMARAHPTKEGIGRLSNAMTKFVSETWDSSNIPASHRLLQLSLLILRYRQLLQYGVIGMHVGEDLKDRNFLRHFISELTSKVFLAADTERRVMVLCDYYMYSPNCHIRDLSKQIAVRTSVSSIKDEPPPNCPDCGHIAKPKGLIHVCENCGTECGTGKYRTH